MNTKEQLIEHLENETRVLQTPEIKNAFEKIDRADFVPEDYKCESYEDYPLPIGEGQTISQPTTVAFMLELLEVQADSAVLDVGSGSGYTTALLAELAKKGNVLGVELVPELAETGERNLQKYNLKNAHIENTDGKTISKDGRKDEGKYDRILVSAAADEVPKNLYAILKIGGIMVVPVDGSVVKITKKSEQDADLKRFPGFAFVPLK